jgi:hypothetical protein
MFSELLLEAVCAQFEDIEHKRKLDWLYKVVSESRGKEKRYPANLRLHLGLTFVIETNKLHG